MHDHCTVILADDHIIVRQTITEWLNRSGDFEVLEQCENADQAVEASRRLKPDLTLLDVEMPGQAVFAACSQILRDNPETKVVFFSGFCYDRHIAGAIAAGAQGFISKAETATAVLSALRAVASGGTYFSPSVRERLVADKGGVRLREQVTTRCDDLSDREIEVLRYIAKGLSKREIGELMCISPRTVERHVFNIMQTLNLHDRVDLTRFAIREQLVVA